MAKKPIKPTKPRIVRGGASKSAKKAAPRVTKTSKQDQVLAMLRRANGASIDEIVAATLAAALRPRLPLGRGQEAPGDRRRQRQRRGRRAALLRRGAQSVTALPAWRSKGRRLLDLFHK
jgi:hypothetical protein